MNELKNNISSILPGLSMAFPSLVFNIQKKKKMED
jgi:hypothetical protein